ncbi:MAG: putative Ig domain-containing protein [Capsulimonas sp.]|uniref:putative Ig domain-containing protein n=1 Tax=Capsulimonas sp. TaxID=2494211 RepID=UPI00326770BA
MSKILSLALAAGLCGVSSLALAADPAPSTAAPDYTSHILTPPASAAPRIHGPGVYGQRPGRPFLYTIPATGDRPMTFSAKGLPKGLKLDPITGRITGRVDKPGTYRVTFRARSPRGNSEKKFRIVIGDQIALTPPMGWNSWNSWAWTVDQDKVLRSAKALVAAGLDRHGWSYINIDDTWQGKPDPKSLALQANERFPDMKALTDQIHGMGLKAGIYSTPWMASYAMYPGSTASNTEHTWVSPPQDKRFIEPNPHHQFGAYSFVTQDAKQWADWGFDYLKYDWNPNDEEHTREMSDALKASGRDFVYSLSNSAPFEHAGDWARLSNAWRTTGDIVDNYESLCQNGFTQSKWAPFSGPGHWNDSDMMILGWVGWGPALHPTHLTADEQYTHMSLWCLLSSPLLIGCDLEKLDPFTLSLLTNDEVIAIDQDPLGRAATQISHAGGDITLTGAAPYASHGETNSVTLPCLQVWAKPLEDGSQAVGLFNLGEQPAEVIADFSDLKMSGKQSVRDLWRQKALGTFRSEYKAIVPAHGVALVKIGAQ